MKECNIKSASDHFSNSSLYFYSMMCVGHGSRRDNDNGGGCKHQLFWTASCQ
jgi:hypothetical protein